MKKIFDNLPPIEEEAGQNQQQIAVTILDRVRSYIRSRLIGQERAVERALTCVLAGGHLLLEGPPGVGKTLLINVLAKALGIKSGRVQFTVDLLPADILGFEIFNPGTGKFDFRQGPVFNQLVLADEINRASPRTQSALLQAMQERCVTIGSDTHALPQPFVVLATQNPVDHVGTFELPAAQLDRFLLCHRLEFPSEIEEKKVIRDSLAARSGNVKLRPATLFDLVNNDGPQITPQELAIVFEAVQQIELGAGLEQHVVDVVRRTREHAEIEIACGPRAGLAFVQAMKARALWCGRTKAKYEDLIELAEDVLCHRFHLRNAGAMSAPELRYRKRLVAEACLNV